MAAYFEDDDYRIDFPKQYDETYLYSWEKQIFIIKAKSTDIDAIYLGINKYPFYFKDGETEATIVLNYTDIINSTDSGEIVFYDKDNVQLTTFEYDVRQGRHPISTYLPPSTIWVESGVTSISIFSFIAETGAKLQQYTGGEWVDLLEDASGWKNPTLTVADGSQFRYLFSSEFVNTSTFDFTFDYTFTRLSLSEVAYNFVIKNTICNRKHNHLQWTGENGGLKDWWFELQESEYLTENRINLQVMTNGFSSLKDKQENITFIERRADLPTYRYLSDIILSDSVKLINDETSEEFACDVATNSIKIPEKFNRRTDFVFSVNFQQYDKV